MHCEDDVGALRGRAATFVSESRGEVVAEGGGTGGVGGYLVQGEPAGLRRCAGSGVWGP